MAITTLEDKFVHELGDIYDAEHVFLEAQQGMLNQANSQVVQEMLRQHIANAKQQIETLEQVYQLISQNAKRTKCEGADAIVKEGWNLLEESGDSEVLVDVAITSAALKMKYYKIASYRVLIAGARMIGLNEIVELLERNLQQEEQAAQKIEQDMPALLQQALSRAALA